MVYEPHPIKIKNFGNDRLFRSVDELREALETDFKGKDTSIVFRSKPSGLLCTVFVSVDESGVVRESYGEQPEIDFGRIAERMM